MGIAGLGTVGAAVLRLLAQNGRLLAERAGREISVTAVSARQRGRDRGVDLKRFRWYDDPLALAADPDVDLVVELIGGADGPALALCRAALEAGKPVVTANKALLAHHGAELAHLAEANGVTIGFEAAVAGGIPIVKTLREGWSAIGSARLRDPERHLQSRPDHHARERPDFDDVLAEAQRLGYAEADPGFDIDGIDARTSSRCWPRWRSAVPPISRACTSKAFATSRRSISPLPPRWAIASSCWAWRGGPSTVSSSACIRAWSGSARPSARSRVFNAVVAEGDQVDATLYSARRRRTDRIGRGRRHRGHCQGASLPVLGVPSAALQTLPTAPMERHYGAYYFRLMVVDQPGVLADVAARLRTTKSRSSR